MDAFTSPATRAEANNGVVTIGLGSMMNETGLLVPALVEAVTLRVPGGALATMNALRWSEPALTYGANTPVPLNASTVPPGTRLAPPKVAKIDSPCTIWGYSGEVRVGTSDAIVNVTELLVPLGVVTVTFRAPGCALDATVNVVVRDVVPETVAVPNVIPVPLTTTVV